MAKWIIRSITIDISIESTYDDGDGSGFLADDQTHFYRVYSIRSAVKRLKRCLKDFQLLKSRSTAIRPEMKYFYDDTDYVEPYANTPEEIKYELKGVPLNTVLWRCHDHNCIEQFRDGEKFGCHDDCSKCPYGQKIDLRTHLDVVEARTIKGVLNE